MKFILRAAVFIASLATVSVCAAKQVSVHDPVMAREGKTYYLYSTGPGITFYSSQDMRKWKPEGRVFATEPAWARKVAPTFDGHMWAPDIQHHNGKYYLYYSVSGFGKNTSAIGVTTNTTLDPRAKDYRWQDQGIIVQSVPNRDNWNAIDSHVIDDADGTPWMSLGSFWSGLKLVKLDASRVRLAEPQEWYSIASRGAASMGPTVGPGEIEAPFIFRKGDYYYLFASWGLCCNGKNTTYHVVVGRAKSIEGPYLDKSGKDMQEGGGSLVITGTKEWKGVGHNSAYTFDGQDFLVMHAYETADKYLQKLKVLPMKWDKDLWPMVDPADLNRYQSKLGRAK